MLFLRILQVLTFAIIMIPEETETRPEPEEPQNPRISLPSPVALEPENEPEISIEQALEVVKAVAAKNPR